MKKLIGVLAVLCALGLAVNVAAAPRQERVNFEKVDANKDKKLTIEEIQAVYPDYNTELHETNDVNKDGVLSAWEWYRANLWPDALAEIETKKAAAEERVRATAGFLRVDQPEGTTDQPAANVPDAEPEQPAAPEATDNQQ